MDKNEIKNIIKNVTEKPALETKEELNAKIKQLESKVNELEKRVVELENKPNHVTFG
jgi:ribosomal protein S20